MCGIVGFANAANAINKQNDLKDWIKQALVTDTVRGRHSTGLAFLSGNCDKWEYIKETMPGWNFVDWKPAEEALSRAKSASAVIGHNRLATVGKVNTHTAHPFKYDDIIGVHNGTLRHCDLPSYHQFEVDSMALISSINEIGAKKTFEKAKGAFAVVWIDLSDDTLNFIRNSERTLYFAWANKGETLLYASEAGLIEWLADRNGVELDDLPYSFKTGVHYSLNLHNIKEGFTKQEIEIQPIVQYNYSFMGKGGNTGKGKGGNNVTRFPGQQNQIQSLLNQVGLSVDDSITFDYESFHLYNPERNRTSKRRGTMYGRTPSDVSVVCHGVEECTVEYLKELPIRSKVVHAFRAHGGSVQVVVREASLEIDTVRFQEEYGYDDDDPKDMVPGPGGVLITEKEFEDLTSDGCSNCSAPFFLDDADNIEWFNNSTPICEKCAPIVMEVK